MMNKLAFQNVKQSARDYLVYFMTMSVVTALMFSFHTLLYSKDVSNSCDYGDYDTACYVFYRPDCGVADPLYDTVYPGKAKQGIWHLSVDWDEEKADLQTVYPREYTAWHRCVSRGHGSWMFPAADFTGCFLQYGADGLPYAFGVQSKLYPDDGGLLRRMLFTGAASV